MVWNCRQKQREVLGKMLNFNAPMLGGGKASDPSEVYKVLVLDRFSKDVIAPLLRVNDLRRHGVTLHLMLEAERQPIPDVPAVYLVQPTASNIDRIAADAGAGLYEAMYLNFTSSLPSKLMEQLAMGVVKTDAANRVTKLYDQFLAFVALEPNLFSLAMQDAYVQLNNPSAQDTQIEATVAAIVDGLFSLCVTTGVVPVIRCPRGGVAEHVAALLDSRLRDALRARSNVFAEGGGGLSASLTRPLLCLFDRNFDMAAVLSHGWTYKPLVHDVLGLHLNRVALAADAPGAAGAAVGTVGKDGKRSYDVDEHDFFWEACGTHEFQRVAEEVQSQTQNYKVAVEEITRSTMAGAQEGAYVDPDELLRKNTQNLMAAVSSLPELQEQKKTLDKHTNLATALLAAIKSRKLDEWKRVGEEVLCGKADLAAVKARVADAHGTPADRLRLAIIWLLARDGMPSDSEYNDLDAALRSSGVDTTALAYVRTLRRNNLVGAQPGQGADGMGGGGGGASSASVQGADIFNIAKDYIGKGVKTLLAGARQAPVTSALEALMDGKQGSVEHETFAVFDPKAPAGRAGPERAKGPFREAIVFMIGGGCYLERETIMTWASKGGSGMSAGASMLGGVSSTLAGPRHVLYGATDMLTGEQFASQLAELGRLSGLGAGKLSLQAAASPALPGQPSGGKR